MALSNSPYSMDNGSEPLSVFDPLSVSRRAFLAGTAAAVAGGCRAWAGPAARVPYGSTIGDRLWRWGHHRDAFKGLKGTKENYNLPYDTRIDMADACRAMGIPGCFVVRWTNKPTAAELPDYM